MNPRLAILGAGGHGLDVAGIARALALHPVFYDDDPTRAPRTLDMFAAEADPRPAVIGVNDPLVRAAIASTFPDVYWALPLIHPKVIGVPTEIGYGSVISPGVVITERVKLGKHVHVNVGATISQTTTIGDYATVSPGAHICGEVTIGARSWIGAGAIVKDHISIGSDVIVGCGSVIIRDVPDGATIVGVPGKPLRKYIDDDVDVVPPTGRHAVKMSQQFGLNDD